MPRTERMPRVLGVDTPWPVEVYNSAAEALNEEFRQVINGGMSEMTYAAAFQYDPSEDLSEEGVIDFTVFGKHGSGMLLASSERQEDEAHLRKVTGDIDRQLEEYRSREVEDD